VHLSGKVDNGLKLLFVRTHWSKGFTHTSWVLSTRSKTGQRTYEVVPGTSSLKVKCVCMGGLLGIHTGRNG
jgi:hypothetical protein